MGDQDARVFLEEGGHSLDRCAVGNQAQGTEAVAGKAQFSHARGQTGGDIGDRIAVEHLDVQATSGIEAAGNRLIEACMVGAGGTGNGQTQAHTPLGINRRTLVATAQHSRGPCTEGSSTKALQKRASGEARQHHYWLQ